MNPDFKAVVLETYLGPLEEMESQLIRLLEQPLDKDFEEVRQRFAQRQALKRYFDSINANAEKARGLLKEYKNSMADQGVIEDDW